MLTFKKIAVLFLSIVITAVLLFFLFRQVDKKSLFEIIKKSDKLLLFFAFLISSLNYILGFYRWHMLLKVLKINLSVKRIITSFSGGIFFNVFLPSTIGGDLVRSMDLSAHTQKPAEILSTVFLDRLSGYIGLVIVTLVALLFGWKFIEDATVFGTLLFIVGLLIAVLLVLFNNFLYRKINSMLNSADSGKIRDLLTNLHQKIYYFREHKSVMLKNIFISILIQTVAPLAFYFISLSLGIDTNIACFFIFLPIIGAITLLPISIGGLGLRDASTIFFFSKVGVSKDVSFAMSLISFFFLLVFAAIGGFIYVLTIHHRRLQPHKASLV
jgi:uncharacterized protein (TIRG00374 family)